jgi:hypothetical protein
VILLPLAQVGVALFAAKETHSFLIFNVLGTMDNGNHFLLNTNGLASTDVLSYFVEVALRRVATTPRSEPCSRL